MGAGWGAVKNRCVRDTFRAPYGIGPAAFGALRRAPRARFFGSRPFSRANGLPVRQGSQPVD